MSKAEERALEAFPLKEDGDSRGSYDLNVVKRIIYQQGYEQAEKDLALTWRDLEEIVEISNSLEKEWLSSTPWDGIKEHWFYQEVLKLYKTMRENVEEDKSDEENYQV